MLVQRWGSNDQAATTTATITASITTTATTTRGAPLWCNWIHQGDLKARSECELLVLSANSGNHDMDSRTTDTGGSSESKTNDQSETSDQVARASDQNHEEQAARATSGFVLLTSLFELNSSEIHAHKKELLAAVGANLLNPFLVEVHILMESTSPDSCRRLPVIIAQVFAEAVSGLAKLRCTRVAKQPTYADFFIFAGQRLAEQLVIVSNTDVVFDDTLGLVDHEHLQSGVHAYVLSVSPPLHGGLYRRAMRRECDSAQRCTIGRFDGWQAGGTSWDSYLFKAPMPAAVNMAHLDFTMNRNHAENHAGAILRLGGLNLQNPCYHVHAYHWHCSAKMHSGGDDLWSPKAPKLPSVLPCLDCAGLANRVDFCVHGSLTRLGPKEQWYFTRPTETFLCCPRGSKCSIGDAHSRLLQEALRLCRNQTDVDCIVTFGAEVRNVVKR